MPPKNRSSQPRQSPTVGDTPANQGSPGDLILPYLARYNELEKLVEYLRKKPLGASPLEITNALGPEILDWRKVEAYKLTGLFVIGDSYSLSSTGVEFSQIDVEGRRAIIREILKKIRPYNGILEWAYFQKKEQLDAGGVRLKWGSEFKEIDTSNKQRFDLAPIFFFSLCEGGGLGRFVTGRKGQSTRLELDVSALDAYISSAPHSSPTHAVSEATHSVDGFVSIPPGLPIVASHEKGQSKKIFVSHGKTKGPLQDVEEMLKIMGLEPRVAIRDPNLARPVSEKVRMTMKECAAAVFIFTPDEHLVDQEGKRVLKPSENVLHELGAAAVLYDDRIVILKEKAIQLPSNISGLAHIPFEMDNVKATFMELYKELKGFKIL